MALMGHIEQLNSIENIEINLYSYGLLIFCKGKNIQWRKDSLSLQEVVLGKLDGSMQINKVRTLRHIIQNNKLKMTKIPKHKICYHKTPKRLHRQNTL